MLHEVLPSDKQCLRCNMDEASIRLFQDTGKGFVTAKVRKRNIAGCGVRRQVSRALQRTAFTCVAIICDNAEIQKILP